MSSCNREGRFFASNSEGVVKGMFLSEAAGGKGSGGSASAHPSSPRAGIERARLIAKRLCQKHYCRVCSRPALEGA